MPGERLVGRAKGKSGESVTMGGGKEVGGEGGRKKRGVRSSPTCEGKGVVKYRGAMREREKKVHRYVWLPSLCWISRVR